MRHAVMMFAGLLAIGLASCSRQIDVAAERAALLATDRQWAEAAASRDVERTVSYWTDDAILLPAGARPVIGKEAIRKFVADSFSMPDFSVSWESTEAVVAKGGDLGYTVGRNRFTVQAPDGNLVTTVGNGVAIWKKESDGTWRCVVDIGNSDPSQDSGKGDGAP